MSVTLGLAGFRSQTRTGGRGHGEVDTGLQGREDGGAGVGVEQGGGSEINVSSQR